MPLKYLGRKNLGVHRYVMHECIECGTEYPEINGHISCNGYAIVDCPFCFPDDAKSVSRETLERHEQDPEPDLQLHDPVAPNVLTYTLRVQLKVGGFWQERVMRLTTKEAVALKSMLDGCEMTGRSLLFKMLTGRQAGYVGNVSLKAVTDDQR